jgi:hypothetical protein
MLGLIIVRPMVPWAAEAKAPPLPEAL